MMRLRFGEHTKSSSIEHGVLRSATLAIACSWPLWIIDRLSIDYPDAAWLQHWLPAVTVLLFVGTSIFMFIAWFSRKDSLLVFASRMAGATTPLALLLLFIAVVLTDLNLTVAHFWFFSFSGIPAVCLALTVKMKIAIPYFIFTVSSVILGRMWVQGWNPWYEIIGEVGFALINTFPFILFANIALSIARVLDDTEAQTRKNLAIAAKLQARSEAKTKFSAFIHDQVLADLSAISRGISPSDTLPQLLDSYFYLNKDFEAEKQSLQDLLTEVINKLDPACLIILHDHDKQLLRQFPEEVIGAIIPALIETLRNSLKHTGPTTSRTCEISIKPDEIKIVLTDNGCGFDVEKIPPTRAGIRVSILGRMYSVNGCDATIDSHPERGTTVTLTWTNTSHSTIDPSSNLSPQHSIYALLGMKIVFSWWFGIAVFCLFADITLFGTPQPGPVEFLITLAFLLIVILIVPGEYEKLPLYKTCALTALLVALPLLAIHQHNMLDYSAWNRYMTFNGFALFTALLAIRGRPLASWITVFSSMALLEAFTWLNINPAPDINYWIVMNNSFMVIAATLMHFGLRYFFRRFPQARKAQLEAERSAAATAELEARRESNLEWLEREVFPVLTAAQLLEEPTPQLKKRARLTELKVRDTLRSPLLDQPVLTAAVWDARARGVTVRLIDDRSTQDDAPAPNLERDMQQLLQQAIRTLDLAPENTEVTIRLSPPHRPTFATIVSDAGMQRILKTDDQ